MKNMTDKATEQWGQGIFKALKAKSAKSDDSPIVSGKMWSKINGGISTKVDTIMDSGCTQPLTTMLVTDAIKMKVTPLARELIIVEASGKNLRILGTVRMYLETEVLGGRKLVEAAVIQGRVRPKPPDQEPKQVPGSLKFFKPGTKNNTKNWKLGPRTETRNRNGNFRP